MNLDEYMEEHFGKCDNWNTFKQIMALENKISKLKSKRRKLKFKKGLYALATAGFVLVSASVFPAIGAGIYRINGQSVFRLDKIECPAHLKKEFGSNEDLEIIKQYYPYESEKSYLYYYDGWKNNGEYYVTNETTYEINGLTYDELINRIDNNENIGKLVSVKKVYKQEKTEDMSIEPYYEGVVYEIDKNDTITVTETKESNNEAIGKILLITSPFNMFAGFITGSILYYEYPFKSIAFREKLADARIAREEKKCRKLVKKL